MKLLKIFFLLLLPLLLFSKETIVVQKKQIFTQEEYRWMKNNPIINVGGETDWAPFDFVNEDGNYDGLSLANDYLKAIELISGLKFKLENKLSY